MGLATFSAGARRKRGLAAALAPAAPGAFSGRRRRRVASWWLYGGDESSTQSKEGGRQPTFSSQASQYCGSEFDWQLAL